MFQAIMEEDLTKILPAGSGVSTIRRCARTIALQKHSRKLTVSSCCLPNVASIWGNVSNFWIKRTDVSQQIQKGLHQQMPMDRISQKQTKNHINCLSTSFFILKSHTIYSQIQHAYQNTLYFCFFYQIQPLAKRSTKCQVNRPLWTEGLLSLLRSFANSRTEEFRFVP